MLNIAAGRLLDLELAMAGTAPEQAPALPVRPVETTPVPVQAPRAKPVESQIYRESPKPGLVPCLPAADGTRSRQETRELARRVIDAIALRKCGTVIPLSDIHTD